jgi:hypothetical protein
MISYHSLQDLQESGFCSESLPVTSNETLEPADCSAGLLLDTKTRICLFSHHVLSSTVGRRCDRGQAGCKQGDMLIWYGTLCDWELAREEKVELLASQSLDFVPGSVP